MWGRHKNILSPTAYSGTGEAAGVGRIGEEFNIGSTEQLSAIAKQSGTNVRDIGAVTRQMTTGTQINTAKRIGDGNVNVGADKFSDIHGEYGADNTKGLERYLNDYGDERAINTAFVQLAIPTGAANGLKKLAEKLHITEKQLLDMTGFWGEVNKVGAAEALKDAYRKVKSWGYEGSEVDFVRDMESMQQIRISADSFALENVLEKVPFQNLVAANVNKEMYGTAKNLNIAPTPEVAYDLGAFAGGELNALYKSNKAFYSTPENMSQIEAARAFSQ